MKEVGEKGGEDLSKKPNGGGGVVWEMKEIPQSKKKGGKRNIAPASEFRRLSWRVWFDLSVGQGVPLAADTVCRLSRRGRGSFLAEVKKIPGSTYGRVNWF